MSSKKSDKWMKPDNLDETAGDVFADDRSSSDCDIRNEKNVNKSNQNHENGKHKRALPYGYSHEGSQKTGLDYLREIAEEESSKHKKSKMPLEYLIEEARNEYNKLKDSRGGKDISDEEWIKIRGKMIQKLRKMEVDQISRDITSFRQQNSSAETNKHVSEEKPRKKRECVARLEDDVSLDNVDEDNQAEVASTEEKFIRSYSEFPNSMFATVDRNGVKMFCCAKADCDVEFRTISQIKRHYLIHTDLKPVKCKRSKCKKIFGRRDNMLYHYRNNCKYRKKK
ncbi:zinc finger C2H2 protein [Vairimorpha necatrix]|uniref:Zinc finger C2H2 protein n=1 Tax=Vairimorpha necatrix TaxID=6039 RepID=A0AAX4JC99_9MICR